MRKNRRELGQPNEEELFARLVAIESDQERAAYLDEKCLGRTQLRSRLERLLDAHDRERGLIDELEEEFVPSLTSPARPQRIGDCEIRREIGRGGMGIVYEAHQVSLNRPVAVKVLSVGLVFSPQAIRRFRREAEAAARLHHTNIVPIFATGTDDRSPYYLMELMPGPSLEQVLQAISASPSSTRVVDSIAEISSRSEPSRGHSGASNGETTCSNQAPSDTSRVAAAATVSTSLGSGQQYFDNVADLIAEVADGLAHAHHEGIIHRDIKPANLLFARDGRLCITDFGLAKMAATPGVTLTGELMGSPRYMSPEQIESEEVKLDHRTDIYSLGVTLYELLTMQPAFPSSHRDQVLTQILYKEPRAPRQLNAQIPRDLETICLKAMEKVPEERYQNADSLADDLRRFVRRRAISARRIGPVGRGWKWCRRNRIAAVLTLLLATTIVIATALLTWQKNEQRGLWESVATEINTNIEVDPWRARLQIASAWKQFPNRRDELQSLLIRIGREATIVSERPGAKISIRPIRFETGNWLSLGTTPVKTNLPVGERYHVRARQDNLNELIVERRFISHHNLRDPDTWKLLLPNHPDMVRISPLHLEEMEGSKRITWLMNRRIPFGMPEFRIDKHEVTNAQFKAFVDAGGYHDPEHWIETLGDDWDVVVREFTDRTGLDRGPADWADGTYPSGMEDHPVVGVSWYEAMAYAHFANKQIPTLFHWLQAEAFNGWSCDYDSYDRYNIGRKLLTHRDVDAGIRSVNEHGVTDMHGNVKEWCLNEEHGGRRYAMGGSWLDDDGSGYDPVAFEPTDRRADVGFRCAVYESNADWEATMPVQWRDVPRKAKPIPPEYVEQFQFDRERSWNTSGPEITTFNDVPAQRVQFDAGYGTDERITCYIILPDRKKYLPPYQVMISTSPIFLDKEGHPRIDEQRFRNISAIMSGGRALVLPTYWGLSYDRRAGEFDEYLLSEQKREIYVDGVVKMAKDLIRTVDFLHDDYPNHVGNDLLDMNKLIFVSCNCLQSECMIVADKLVTNKNRFAAAFFFLGGIHNKIQPAEVDQLTYLPHLDTPTIILNKEGHLWYPREFSQDGMLNLLPLHEDLKKLYSIPRAHIPLRQEHTEREGNSWLNQLESLGKPRTVGDTR